jgi:hypothetical protein
MTSIQHFFTRYEEGANSFDPDEVAFWISHDDEQKVLQEAGLIPKEMPNKPDAGDA